MNILLVYPQYPDSFWSFRHAIRFISKKASIPPLGLITVSAMLPVRWNKKLVDLNIAKLKVSDILWADYIFISAMHIQKESVNEIIKTCQKYKKAIVAGGPLFTQEYHNYPQVDHLILNEAEITAPRFLDDLEKNKQPQHIYRAEDHEYADLSLSPVPDYHLLSRKHYAFMNLQITRGCPFGCDFCEITSLLGRKVRMKPVSNVIRELDLLYKLKWRGGVFIVDDNFIGRRREVKDHLLPAIDSWMRRHQYPFMFTTQSSIDLADDNELLGAMVHAGFTSTFIGIETPAEESLQECNKSQNKNRDMLESVRKIQRAGLLVSGGFIVGFDSDKPSIFQKQVDFIQESGIVAAMVGLLNAPRNTQLFKRLLTEKRLISEPSGSNTDMSMNFVPTMPFAELLNGYRKIIQNIYSVQPYYKRIKQLLTHYKRPKMGRTRIKFNQLSGFAKSVVIIGILNKGRFEYWKLLFWALYYRPGLLIEAVTFAVYGYHFRKVYKIKN